MPTGVYTRSKSEMERLKRLGKANGFKKGVRHSRVWNKGTNTSGMKGKKHTPETRRKIAEKRKGSKTNLWKGGVAKQNEIDRKSVEYKLWREAVYKRDNWTCQDCRARAKKGKRVTLHPHHIKPFSKYKALRFAIDNGVTLCFGCHQKRHKDIKLTVI